MTNLYDNEFNLIQITMKVSNLQNYVEGYEYNKLYQVTKITEDKNGFLIKTQKAFKIYFRYFLQIQKPYFRNTRDNFFR